VPSEVPGEENGSRSLLPSTADEARGTAGPGERGKPRSLHVLLIVWGGVGQGARVWGGGEVLAV
jgi:hypothetical protein